MKRLVLLFCVASVTGCSGCGAQPASTKAPEKSDAPAQPQVAALPDDPAQARHALIDQAKETPAPVVVIALDGETLFDASGRSRRIFLEVLAEAGKNDLMRTVMERVEQGAPHPIAEGVLWQLIAFYYLLCILDLKTYRS